MIEDLRHGLRLMRKNPGFTAVAVVTLGLGIGANAAIFSLVNAILLRPLPYPNPEQLIGLGQWRNQHGVGYIQTGVSAPNVDDIEKSGIFQQVAYYRWGGLNITEGNRPESVDSIKASDEMLPLFGVQPLMGRFLTKHEMEAGRDQVAVIGNRLWQTRFGADRAILGKNVELDQRRYTIVGVMPASFRFTWDQEIDVFVPLVLTPEERSEAGRGTSRDLQVQGRLKPGISVEQAQAAMDTLASSLAKRYPAANEGWGLKVEPLHAAYHRRMEKPLAIMLGAVTLVLLIACVNMANLLLARATERKREIAIRVSIGATRRRLIGQLMTESLLLAMAGGMAGLLIAYLSDRVLTVTMTRYNLTLPNAKIIDIDWRVLLFCIGITAVTGILFGLVPAWAMAKASLNDSLKESSASTTSEGGRRRLRKGLVVCETALALVLLMGAGLLVRTFAELAKVDLGFEPDHVLTMRVSLPTYKYRQEAQQAIFFRDLMQAATAIPGVRAAGAQAGGANVFFQPEGGRVAEPGHEPTASYKVITNGYLKAMGMRLVAGREFSERDKSGTTPVALISESVARQYFPGADPIGRHMRLLARVYSGQRSGVGEPLEIVGVVKDVRNNDLWRPETAIYVPFEQKPSSAAFLAVRTAVPPMNVAGAVRAAVLSLDKEQPVGRIRTMQEIVALTYGALRFPVALLAIFSVLALVLSAIGIFGVMSYTVSRRTREMGIRMALGASRRNMLGLVLREGLAVTLLGVAIGVPGALLIGRMMAGYLYGITATDPMTFAATALLLICVALLASYLPARRAARVDPTVALRYE